MDHFESFKSNNNEGIPQYYFIPRNQYFDWSSLNKLDIESIIHHSDIKSIEQILENITFAKIELIDIKNLPDEVIIKFIKSAQLIIDYFIYSQEILVKQHERFNKKFEELNQQLSKELKENEMLKSSLSETKRQIQIQKKLITTYESLSKNGHKCKFCKKMFISMEFLTQHYKKKHPNENETLENEPENKADLKEIQTSIGKYVNNILDNSVRKLEQLISENQKNDESKNEVKENEKIIEKVVEKTILMMSNSKKSNEARNITPENVRPKRGEKQTSEVHVFGNEEYKDRDDINQPKIISNQIPFKLNDDENNQIMQQEISKDNYQNDKFSPKNEEEIHNF